ncbi:MAG: CinA family protein [Gammaproteobacteria bacterium]|jgi:nicotinamide-nucleotide amidase|nr:CinA family protein [Gammaproteobacteria bacterium]
MESGLKLLARGVGETLLRRKLVLATAESCTGGWVAQVITAVPGSSQWFDRGFVTYSNAAKREMLGVRSETLERFGAVSEEVAREMAEGALDRSHAQITLAISGIAGPGGGTEQKPVGTVCFAWAAAGRLVTAHTAHYIGDRTAVRWQAATQALQGVLDLLERPN